MRIVEVVAGIVFNDDAGQVLLALRKPDQHQGDRWEFPGGKMEASETQQAALARELEEEIAIKVDRCHHRLTLEYEYPDKHVRLHFWNVTSFTGEPAGCEGQALRWVSLAELSTLRFPDANQVVVDQLVGSP